MFELLWTKRWWSYQPGTGWDVYHAFNLFEAACWILFGLLALIRFARFQRSSLELLYGGAFLAFGVTDIVEAWSLPTWLIWAKGVNVAALYWLRRRVMRDHYPTSKLF